MPSTSGFRGSKFRDFKKPNIKHKQILKLRKDKNVELTFQDFGVRNPATSKVETSTTDNSQIVKRKERGTNILGFWNSGFWGFKCQTT
jgi:hypothetical protein